METPPVSTKKCLDNSMTKASLTPCRRLGLGRPSSSSLKKTHLVRTLVGSSDKQEDHVLLQEDKSVLLSSDTSVTCNGSRLPSLLKDRVGCGNTIRKSRCCLTFNPDLDIKSSSLDFKSHKVLKHYDENYVLPCNMNKKRKLNEDVDIKSKTSTTVQKKYSCSVSLNSSDSEMSLCDSVKNVTTETIEQLALSIRKKKMKLEELKVQEMYAKKHDLAELRQQTAKWRTAGQEALRFSLNLAKQAGYSVTLKQLMSQHGFLPHLIGYSSEDDEFC